MLKRKTALLLSVLTLFLSSAGSALAADKTSKYRVYQNDKLLTETSDYKTAEAYARGFADSHVEEIGTRKWLWNNYPRYKVYQNSYTSSGWEFATLDQAVQEASHWGHASVRDLQSGGWVWNNYPKYRLYQGEITLDSWDFPTLNQAIAEGKKWSNSHIIDLSDNSWTWDNITESQKNTLRTVGTPIYQVTQDSYAPPEWRFAYLEDAVKESLRWGGSKIVNTATGGTVFSNERTYHVYQYDNLLSSFIGVDAAIQYAQQFDHTRITDDSAPRTSGGSSPAIWNNYPYYRVFQKDSWISDFSTIGGALNYAMGYTNASVRLYDGDEKIWDNLRNLKFWGWNGSSADSTIRAHVNNTKGLDVVSPTYFQLADAAGGLTDSSNKDTVAWLKKQGLTVYPLVSNQFDQALTTQFLSASDAVTKFVGALTDKAASLGVDGINVDFESVAGKDRANFTNFMQQLTTAAHQKGLTVSVDLPRGSVKWNAAGAFDHEKLGQMVDYIITMAYDQYWTGSTEPGSVAGLQWVEQGVQEFLSYGIPRDKLIMGMPFYVREWKIAPDGTLNSNRALLLKDLPALIASKNPKLTYDSRFNQYKVEYSDGGFTNVFWLENEETIKARLEIAKKYELAGVAAWRLGYDSSDLWSMMIQDK
ncbi:glycosyl hydrolase family 18 protein [Paenibacillus filicis]|uniref:Glycosyl hydrolase family 18 protein n=1 Tax=Paenibacillus gyeongsangnamensis TaxID=3388067 RepID=A0ABT4Q865_9BACL|nr:glycosyl hydrolase family 18 protein [Paenibacillus filicis]MCZ8513071.1 glycosyl hydrolase family 18 protein [Paenibacillus filicis]